MERWGSASREFIISAEQNVKVFLLSTVAPSAFP
jgi:hypothetical protein